MLQGPVQAATQSPYFITLGNSHSLNQGYSGLFIKEVRVWSIVLDSETIQDNRLKLQESENLIAYLKLQTP